MSECSLSYEKIVQKSDISKKKDFSFFVVCPSAAVIEEIDIKYFED